MHGVGFFDRVNCADNRVEHGANRVDSEHDRNDSYHNRVDSGDTHNATFESIVLKQTACHSMAHGLGTRLPYGMLSTLF